MTTINLGKIKPVVKGAYSSVVQYEELDIVTYNGISFIANQATLGNAPDNVTYWSAFTTGGADQITSATTKSTPVDADTFGFVNSSGGLLAKFTWANLKAALKSDGYFDPVTSKKYQFTVVAGSLAMVEQP